MVKFVVWGIIVAGLLLACQTGTEPRTALPSGTDGGQTSGPSASPTPFKSELVICATSEPDRLLLAQSPVGQNIERALVRPAVSYGVGYMAQSDLLLALPSEADGSLRRNDDGTLSVILHYRADLVWSDGEPFKTADAVLGFKAPNPDGDTAVLDAQEGDALSVFLRLPATTEYPYMPDTSPLPSHIIGSVDPATVLASGYARLMNPTLGPYYVSEWTAGQSIVLQANPYYSPAPIIPTVRFQFGVESALLINKLTSEECDAALNDSLTLDHLPALMQPLASGAGRRDIRPGSVNDQIVFNTYTVPSPRVAYFADSRVRQAVAFAFDRAALGEALWQGAMPLMDSWLPSEHWAYTPGGFSSYSLDIARAQSLLDQAGWMDQNGDGVREYHGEGGEYACQRGSWQIAPDTPLTPVVLLPTGDPVRAQIADRIKADLAQVGIAVQVQPVDPSNLFAAGGPVIRRDFDLALLTAVTRPDPGGINAWVGADVFLHPINKTPVHRWELEDRWLTSDQLVERLALSNIPSEANDFQGQNYAGWCNEQADLIMVQANRSLDTKARVALYAQHQQMLAADVPILPLFARPRLVAGAMTICGIQPGPFDPVTWNLESWSFDSLGQC